MTKAVKEGVNKHSIKVIEATSIHLWESSSPTGSL
jgi:hypothetical protein